MPCLFLGMFAPVFSCFLFLLRGLGRTLICLALFFGAVLLAMPLLFCRAFPGLCFPFCVLDCHLTPFHVTFDFAALQFQPLGFPNGFSVSFLGLLKAAIDEKLLVAGSILGL